MLECYNCGCWDSDYEGCTCPSVDRWFACPIEAKKHEKDFNCEILVTQDKRTNRYRFDDYRIATAIENLLLNMDCVFTYEYDKESTIEQDSKSEWEHDHEILKAYDDGANEVLDKIRVEIERCYCEVSNEYDKGRNYGLYMATQVIDKYKAESEG